LHAVIGYLPHLYGEFMKTKHAEKRAQQRGINASIEKLLQLYGDKRPAPNGCVVRFFSKRSIQRIETLYGHSFIARNHEKMKSYLIQRRDSHAILTIGKIHSDQRLTSSKVNRIYH